MSAARAITCQPTNGRPLAHLPVPPGTPRWGARWKEEAKKNYLRSFGFASQGSSYAAYANYLDLDPTYTDRFGRPLLRMTFDFPDNDIRMSNYVVDKMEPIAKAMNPRQYVVNRRAKPYSVVPDQSTHNTGGAIMGADPKTSAVNKYLQSWDVPNVFVIGASAFPQNAGLQSERHRLRARLPRRRRDHLQISKVSRPAGADVRRATHPHFATLPRLPLRCLRQAPSARSTRSRPTLVERGRYLATAADCAACHTKPGGKPFAGGVALQTPFGTLVGPNITPDPEAGIGSWTDDDFVSALRDGRGRGDIRLYPAMPYPAYTKMTREDALAIRAYLRTIDPAPDKIESNQLPFPFNIRSTMIVWNAINFTPGRLARDPSKSAQWNRGHYLVDALGHCGTCHTPKTIMGADKNSAYLQGGLLQDWYAPNITADLRKGIGRWSVEDIVTYLKTGANRYAMASGGMGEEVVHSSSHMTDDDLKAIAVYLLSLKPAATAEPAGACRHRCAHAGRPGDLQRQLRRLPYRRRNGRRSPLSAPRRKPRGAVR